MEVSIKNNIIIVEILKIEKSNMLSKKSINKGVNLSRYENVIFALKLKLQAPI